MAVPSEALERRRELSHGAWDLYERYCWHRNRDTGRCDPSLEFLKDEMKRTYTYISNMKSELVRKGWIRRTGRHAVELLVGEFPPPKVRSFVRKNPNEAGSSLGKIITPVRKDPNEAGGAPYITEPLKEPVIGAAAAPAAVGSDAWKKELCDEAYVAQVKQEGIYPPPFVEFVWRKLKSRCRKEGVAPNKGRFEFWLSQEKSAPVQPELFSHTVSHTDFQSGDNQPVKPALRDPDPNCMLCRGDGEVDGQVCACRQCQYCFGTGMEIMAGKGARRCRCLRPTSAAPPVNDEELRALEQQYEEAQEEMRRRKDAG